MKNRRPILLLVIGILVLGTVLVMFMKHGKSSGPFTFTNLSSCAKGVDGGLVDNLDTQMYSYIKKVNAYNEAPTAAHYDGTLRTTSCVTKTNNGIMTTTAIVDIPTAKQSWQISFNWDRGSSPNTDLGALTTSCLPTSQLAYGDFGCTQVLSLQKYGTDEYDPILQYTPYTSPDFNIAYNSDTKAVDVTILVRPQDANNTVLISNDKEAVGLWFTQHHLNISDYSVQYAVSQAAE